MASKSKLSLMQTRITDEIFNAIGINPAGKTRRMFGWVFHLPTRRFVRMFADADQASITGGLQAGAQVVQEFLGVEYQAHGLENLNIEGPLLIVSNHPGAYDTAILGASIPRVDLKWIVMESAFYRTMPNLSSHLCWVTKETTGRMLALRCALEHLQQGGAVFQYGSGTVDPDPEVHPGAVEELEKWSPSIEILLRKVPETRLVLAITSGVVLPRFANHPIARIQKKAMERRRLAEYIQVIQQLTFPWPVKVLSHMTYAPPITVPQLESESEGNRLMPAILQRARNLLAEHCQIWNIPLR